MRRDQPTALFDVEADELDGLTDQFWGSTRGWVSRDTPTITARDRGPATRRRDDTTGSMRALRDGFAAFRPRRRDDIDHIERIGRTRQHGVVRDEPLQVAPREATLSELASGWHDDVDTWTADVAPARRSEVGGGWQADDAGDDVGAFVPLSSSVQPLAERLGVGAVDPLLLRLGLLVLVGVLLVPIALALRPSTVDGAVQTATPGERVGVVVDESTSAPVGGAPSGDTAPTSPAGSTVGDGVDADISVDGGAAATGDVTASTATASDGGDQVAGSTTAESAAATDESMSAGSADQTGDASVGDVAQSASNSAISEGATVSASAERVVPACPLTYEAGSGDSWYRIADGADVSPSALLAENRATFDTVIFPGDEICLPAGATVPSPPPAPSTTVAPSTTAPATTAPPSTTPPASTAEVQQIIRDVWPDELEEKALAIAWRESGYVATAHNGWCCYGVFQIYWTVHAGWLDDYGIYQASDLYDARKNTQAAYALYQRSGGWGPWGG